MSGLHVPLLKHVVKRGVDVAQSHFSGPSQEYIAQLQHDAELYENSGPEMSIEPMALLGMIITVVGAMLVIATIRYTVGEVIASLTMIESPTTTAIIDDKPPAYADEPDAPIEKAPLMPSEAEADVEVTLIRHERITAKIRTASAHLVKVGGSRGRWRGVFVSVFYHFAHSSLTHFVSSVLGAGIVGYSLVYVLASLGLARVHMAWTHAMVAAPSAKPWWRRMVSRKQARVVLLPTLVLAVAQQALFGLPILMAVVLGLHDVSQDDVINAAQNHEKGCGQGLFIALRLFIVAATALFVAVFVLLPASITLTRIEAALLPENEETIVPFDRLAIMGDVDITARGAPKAVFSQAWRSVDWAARWRVVKLYAKMVLMQFTIAIATFHIILAEVYFLGAERLSIVTKSGIAQLKLMAIEAQENAN